MLFAVSALALLSSLSAVAAVKIDLKPFVEFATEWTSYPYHGEPLPKILIERDDLVQVDAYGALEYAQAEAKGKTPPHVNAIYVAADKTLYLSDKLDVHDPKAPVTLVHEMVHYLQDISGYTRALGGHLSCTESEAYDVQAIYQQMHQIAVEELPFVYQLSMVSAIRCMGNKSAAFGHAI